MRMSFELRQLRHFESLCRIKNFRLAAEEQNLTHSALTKSIRKLENDLGVRLFDRTTRIVEPTSAGTHLMDKVRVLLEQAESLVFEAKLVTGARIGELRVGCGPFASDTIMPDALSRFCSDHGDVNVDVHCEDPSTLIEKLVAGVLDFAIFDRSTPKSDKYRNELRVDPLLREELVVAFRRGHPASAHSPSSGAYQPYPWALPMLDLVDNNMPSAIAQQLLQRDGRTTYRFQTLHACLDLAACSDVVTGAPVSMARRWNQLGRIDYAHFDEPLYLDFVISSIKRRTFSPVAEALIQDMHVVVKDRAAA